MKLVSSFLFFCFCVVNLALNSEEGSFPKRRKASSNNISLSVPRSGKTYTLRVFGDITGKRFPFLTYKPHEWPVGGFYVHDPRQVDNFKKTEKGGKLLFIFRNPKEIFFRWVKNNTEYPFGFTRDPIYVEHYSNDLKMAIPVFMREFLKYIECYERWEWNKYVVHYEDVISKNAVGEFSKLLNFFGESQKCLNVLKKNQQQYFNSLLRMYERNIRYDGGGMSIKNKSKPQALYYSEGKPSYLLKGIDEFLKANVSKKFWNKHLKRYAETNK